MRRNRIASYLGDIQILCLRGHSLEEIGNKNGSSTLRVDRVLGIIVHSCIRKMKRLKLLQKTTRRQQKNKKQTQKDKRQKTKKTNNCEELINSMLTA